MERKLEGISIQLRFMVFKSNGRYYSICLETNIANRANTLKHLQEKDMDSAILYLTSFTPEELASKKYFRKASLSYRLQWYMTKVKPFKKVKNDTGIFDTNSGSLRFA